jgi:Zn-finger nucleic acid-binding protein
VIVEFGGVEVDACAFDHGLWLDAQELDQLRRRSAPDGGDSPSLEPAIAEAAARRGASRRRCPRCDGRMEEVAGPAAGGAYAALLDRCPRGHGLWFDPGELEQVLDLAAHEPPPGLADLARFLAGYAQPSRRPPDGEAAAGR